MAVGGGAGVFTLIPGPPPAERPTPRKLIQDDIVDGTHVSSHLGSQTEIEPL